MDTSMVCPTCGGTIPGTVRNSPFPFCSARCKLLDLGNWFNERYRLEADPAPRLDEASDD